MSPKQRGKSLMGEPALLYNGNQASQIKAATVLSKKQASVPIRVNTGIAEAVTRPHKRNKASQSGIRSLKETGFRPLKGIRASPKR